MVRKMPRETTAGQNTQPHPLAHRLLGWLLRHPFQRADDIATVLGCSLAQSYSVLAQLHQQGLLESIAPATLAIQSCRLYCLSQHGLTMLAHWMHTDPIALARRHHSSEEALLRLIPQLPTRVLLSQCLFSLMRYAPSIYTAQGRRLYVQWDWQADYHYQGTYRDRTFSCTAEAVLTWQVRADHTSPHRDLRLKPQEAQEAQQTWYSLVVLQDTGLDDRPRMRHRIEQWLWCRENPSRWAFYPHFPAIIILVADHHRSAYWREAMREASQRMNVPPLRGAITVLPPLQPMRSPYESAVLNAWKLPWMSLTAVTPCRLEDVCLPLPAHALLPQTSGKHRGQTSEQPDRQAPLADSPHTQKDQKERSSNPEKRRSAIRGQWFQRACTAQQTLRSQQQTQQPQLTQTTRESPETLAWLSLLLGRRHLDLLTFLWNHPLLPTETIAALLTLQEDSVRRYLREMACYGCIEPWSPPLHAAGRASENQSTHPPAKKTFVGWFLTERGLRLLAACHHVHLLRVGTYEQVTHHHASHYQQPQEAAQAKTPLLLPHGLQQAQRFVSHHQGLYKVLGKFHQDALACGYHILWWETGAWCERSYPHEGQQHNVRPDAAFAYEESNYLRQGVREKNVQSVWLEWDSGTMNQRDLHAKLSAYAAYDHTRTWVSEGRVYLPLLLFIVPDAGQEARVQRVTQQVFETRTKGVVGLHIYTTTLAHIEQYGCFATIWRPVLPTQNLTPTSSARIALHPTR